MEKKINDFFNGNKPIFIKGVVDGKEMIQYCKNKIDIAFIGRSNVGKSSLINCITNSSIAKTSKTAGRTREINLFSLGEKAILVDMPGYGYATADDVKKYDWRKMIYDYLTCGCQISRLFILIDSRRGIKEIDFDFLNMLEQEKNIDIQGQIVLTKIDCLKLTEQQKIKELTAQQITMFRKIIPTVLAVSSTKKYGIMEIKKEIFELVINTGK